MLSLDWRTNPSHNAQSDGLPEQLAVDAAARAAMQRKLYGHALPTADASRFVRHHGTANKYNQNHDDRGRFTFGSGADDQAASARPGWSGPAYSGGFLGINGPSQAAANAHDAQQLYQAESRAALLSPGGKGAQYATQADAQTYANSLWLKYGVGVEGLPANQAPVIQFMPLPPSETGGLDTSLLAQTLSGNGPTDPDTIMIYPSGENQATIIHEVAHAIAGTGYGNYGHGSMMRSIDIATLKGEGMVTYANRVADVAPPSAAETKSAKVLQAAIYHKGKLVQVCYGDAPDTQKSNPYPRQEHGRFGWGASHPAKTGFFGRAEGITPGTETSTTDLTPRQQRVLSEYGAPETSDLGRNMTTSKDINDYLRNGTQSPSNSLSDVQDAIKNLDAAEQNSTLSKDVTVYRGMSADMLPAGNLVGQSFTDKGFVTVAMGGKDAEYMASNFPVVADPSDHDGGYQPDRSANDPILRITVPSGTNLLTHSTLDYEEGVIPRGSTFTITGAAGSDKNSGRPIYTAMVSHG